MQPAPQSVAPRVMTKAEAAAYCRLTPSGFTEWVAKKRLPGPIPGTRRWDKAAIDAALDRLSGLGGSPSGKSALAQWREKRDARQAEGR